MKTDPETNPRKMKLGGRKMDSLRPEERPYEVMDTDQAGLLLRVQPASTRHPQGVMTYYVRYRLADGRETRLKLGRHGEITATQARRKALDARRDVVHGLDPAAKRKEVKAHTLATFLDEIYGPWVKQHRKSGAATAARLRAAFNGLLGRKLEQITPWLVEKWRSERKASGTAVTTINRDLTALKAAMNRAVEWELLKQNPIGSVKHDRSDRQPVVRFLFAHEESALRAALDTRETRIREERANHNKWLRDRGRPEQQDLSATAFADYVKPMVLVSINTGVRRGELFNLQWSDIDLVAARLTVRGATAKSGSTRYIPLNSEALATLRGWRAQTEGGGYVFESPKGGRFDNVTKAWKGVLREAGLCVKEKDADGKERVTSYTFRWHDMRHDFASKLVMEGVDLYVVKVLLGHFSIMMTEIYAHLAPNHLAGAVAVLDRPQNIVQFPQAAGASTPPQGGGQS